MQSRATNRASHRRTYAHAAAKLALHRADISFPREIARFGRVPELSDAKTSWPYAVIGIAFAIYGVSLFMQGNSRARAQGLSASDARVDLALAAAGPALGVVVIVLIAFTA